MQAALQRRASGQSAAAGKKLRSVSVSKVAFVGMLQGLRRAIAAMKAPGDATVWSDYAQHNSYGAAEADAKRRFVQDMVAKVRPRQLIDLGCNSGDYSEAALQAGAGRVIGFDFDHGALNLAAARAEAKKLDFLPLWLDAANPSPSQGWRQSERLGLAERLNADAAIALALVHHLAISRNIPLDAVVDWIIGMAPVGVIECPDKSDPMVQQLLALREDTSPTTTTTTSSPTSPGGRASCARRSWGKVAGCWSGSTAAEPEIGGRVADVAVKEPGRQAIWMKLVDATESRSAPLSSARPRPL